MTQTRKRPGSTAPGTSNEQTLHGEFKAQSTKPVGQPPSQLQAKGISAIRRIRSELKAGTLQTKVSTIPQVEQQNELARPTPIATQAKKPTLVSRQPEPDEGTDSTAEDLAALTLDQFRSTFVGFDLDYALDELQRSAGPLVCYRSRQGVSDTGPAPGRIGLSRKIPCRQRLTCVACRNRELLDHLNRAAEAHRYDKTVKLIELDNISARDKFTNRDRQRRHRDERAIPAPVIVPRPNGGSFIIASADCPEGEELEHREGFARLAGALADYWNRPKNDDRRRVSGLPTHDVADSCIEDLKQTATQTAKASAQQITYDGEQLEFVGFTAPGEDITNQNLAEIADVLNLPTETANDRTWVIYRTEDERQAITAALKNRHGLIANAELRQRKDMARHNRTQRDRYVDEQAEREWYR